METIDHIAARVTIAACIGALTGSMSGLLKGYRIHRVAMASAVSTAAVATACLIVERLSFIAIEQFNPLQQQLSDSKQIEPVPVQENRRIISLDNLLASHACGGIVGGAFSGLIYVQKPVAGALFLTPFMCAAGYVEYRYQALRVQQEIDAKEGR
jgi:hypothetical protein